MAKRILLLFGLCCALMVACKKAPEANKTDNNNPNDTTHNPIDTTSVGTACNGSNASCGKRYDQVVYVTTHNSYNYRFGPNPFSIPNQTYDVQRQLQDGVRAFMLDVYYNSDSSQVIMYHGFSSLGQEPLLTSLQYMHDFLQTHPHEVLTIIFECYVYGKDIATVMDSAGLTSYLHPQSANQPWPTLQQMIGGNNRLVVFSDQRDDTIPWYHYCWDYAVETPFSNSDTTDFTCTYNRGNPSNSLFILNHFLTVPVIGVGDTARAHIANTNPYFINRVLNCSQATGKIPNFLTVDFYDIGDVFAVADSINKLH